MNIGLLDLLIIYSFPVLVLIFLAGAFLACLYMIVRFDLFRLDFSYDVLIGLKYRKKAFSPVNVALLLLFDNGMQATLLYRISRYLHLKGLGQAALVINKISKYITNMDISPSAKIGKGLSLWHGTSIIIAQFAEVGERCVVRQGVTVCGFGKVRVGNDVSFSHGAFAIEGNPDPIEIGDGSVIAANAVVTKSVPPNHIAAGVPAGTIIEKPGTQVEGVIFDMDRVLVDTDEAVFMTLQSMMKGLGRKPLARKRFERFRNMPVPLLLERLLQGPDLGIGGSLFLQRFQSLCEEQVHLREGTRETLVILKEMGIMMGAFSRLFGKCAERILKQNDLEGLVRVIKGFDELDEWKPHPRLLTEMMGAMGLRKENALYVGCSTLDLRTGNNAAIRVAVLPLGVEPKERLVRSVPRLVDNKVLDHIGQIPDYIREKQGGTLSSEAVCM